MRTHLLITALALIITACASKENRPIAQNEMDDVQHWSMTEGAASRIR